MTEKRKLLVVAGAGASVDFGMPSVGGVHDFLLKKAQELFPLVDDPKTNLYGSIFKSITDYWGTSTASFLNKTPNFEDVLYAISALASVIPAGNFTGPLGAFVTKNPLPSVVQTGSVKLQPQDVLRHLGQTLVDELLDEFRRRCRQRDPLMVSKVKEFGQFFAGLTEKFDCAVVTTNYDDLICRSLPGIETGFDPSDGRFKQGRIVNRTAWPCLLHLHGCVHFDMDVTDGDLHGVIWQPDLDEPFHQNSFGRLTQRTAEGNEFPTSSIIAGYGKTQQIQRLPFRTYYSELDRLVYQSDALLFAGFSLADAHVRTSFANYRDGRERPVVFLDFAKDGEMLAGGDFDDSVSGPARALRVFRAPSGSMKWLGYSHPNTVDEVRRAREFERCTAPGKRLSIWYNGMLEACRHTDKILHEFG